LEQFLQDIQVNPRQLHPFFKELWFGPGAKWFRRKNGWEGGFIDRCGDWSSSFEEQAGRPAYRPADVGRLLSPTELRHKSRDQKGFYPDHASGKRRFDSGSWHEEEVPNRDQMSLHSVTLLTENPIFLPVQWRLCLLSFLLPVCVLSWTCIPFLESRLSLSRISGLGYSIEFQFLLLMAVSV
jgi:hypothetical protein